jgi:hypothetical protein
MLALALALVAAQGITTVAIPESGRLETPAGVAVRLAFPKELSLADLRSTGKLQPTLIQAQPLVMELSAQEVGTAGAIIVVGTKGEEVRVECVVVEPGLPASFRSARAAAPTPTPAPTPEPTPTPAPTPTDWCAGINASGFALAKLERRGVTTSLPGQRNLELEHTARSTRTLWYRFRLRGGARDVVTNVSWSDGRAIHACVSDPTDKDLRILVETAVDEDKGADLLIEFRDAGRYKPRLSKGLLRRMRDVVF